jgi:preprotein translocase subunit SecG
MFTFLLIVHAIIAAALVTVILMQRSEGGGLASGGSPSGLMSARGAADFLTRTTTILASLFVLLSIGLAGLATVERAPREIDTSLARQQPAAPAPAPASDVPLAGDPLTAAGQAASDVPPAAPATTAAPVAAPKEAPRARPAEKAAAPAPAKVAEEPVLKLNQRPDAPVTITPPPPPPANKDSSVPLAE